MSPNARRLDAGLGITTAAVVATAVTANVRGDGTAPVAYLFAAGFGALMLVRRSQPVLALVASGIGLLGYYALGLPPIGLALPVGAALYSAAEAGRLRWAIGTATALIVISSAARTLGGEDPAYLYAYELPTTVAVMAAAIVLGDGVRSRRLWRAEVAARLAREAEQRVQHERLALARDLHDVLAHTISVVTLHADVATEALEDGDPAAARTAIGRVRQASGGAARELRGTLAALRSDPAPPPARNRAPAQNGAPPPLGVLAQVGELTGDAVVDVTVVGDQRPLPMLVDATAYRVVQEALTNARRHAPGCPVRLTISYRPTELSLHIVNETVAGATGPHGYGLRGMRERVGLLGGSLRAGPATDGTFEVTATLPAEAATTQPAEATA
jgi:signal transduction histidine kinase